MSGTIEVAVVFLLSLQCYSALKHWTKVAQSATPENNVNFKILTTTKPSFQWLQYQHERFEYERKSSHTDLKRRFENSVWANSHIELETKRNKMLTLTPQTLNEIKGSKDDQGKEESKEAQMKATGSKPNKLIYENILVCLDGFKAFFKSAAQIWTNRHTFSMNQKIILLQKLKERLLKSIEKQFITLWRDDEHSHVRKRDAEEVRKRRSILDESNISFPPEAALLSINFLTFAVFLIKLVLKCNEKKANSLVFGGNFLHSFGIVKQLKTALVENVTKVPQKFRYPFFTEMLWYVLARYVYVLLDHSHLDSETSSDENEMSSRNCNVFVRFTPT
uniref:Uncharacterized protein n=1 Tax=Glossina brevipalpis TaxID=37001 RepID=A0A1A9W3K3_9MUSC